MKIVGRVGGSVILLSVLLTACGVSNDDSTDNSTPDSNPPVTVQTPDTVGEVVPQNQQRVIPNEELKPYIAGSAYGAVLYDCALADSDNLCTLSTLPYIGQQATFVSVDDVMQRVLVTHDWMGVRFEQMLQKMPADMLPMFAPVTAIYIGSEVRPSAFSSIRGAVRIDPRLLWLSVDEKRTVATNDDPRSNYGNDLQFVGLWRFTIGDDYAWRGSSLTDDSERTLDQLTLPLASLLYHELAHANDYVQPNQLAALDTSLTPREVIRQLEDTRVSIQLYRDEALTARASYLYGLGGVRYFDDEPTEFQKSLLADFVGAEMSREGKLIFYSYATAREDVAMLVESTMMKLHYNVDAHVGFANKPTTEDFTCNDYKVAWGERNRLASALVQPRAQYVSNRIMPHSSANSFLAGSTGSAQALREGDGWCESRFTDTSSGRATLGHSSNDTLAEEWDIFQRQGHLEESE